MLKYVKIILTAALFALSVKGFAQIPVIADPATGPITITNLSGVTLVPSQLIINEAVFIKVPVYNNSTTGEVPDGSCFLKIGLGSKMVLDVANFDLSTAQLFEYFTWNINYINGSQWEISGELIAPLPPGFSGVAVFRVLPNVLNASSLTTNFLVTNHIPGVILSDENGANNTASTPYFVNKKPQTITFNPLSNKIYGDPIFALNATASSGLGVSYTSSNTNVATVSGNVVTILSTGTTNITATQPGNGIYNPAPAVIQSLTVNPKNLTVSGIFAENKVYDGTTAAVINMSGAILTGVVGADVVTLSGTGSFTDANAGTGKTVNTALILGGADAFKYTISPLTLLADITQASQSITFNPLPVKTTTDLPFALTATASSGLSVSYISSNPSVATVSGNTVTIVGLGTTIITAMQAGNINYTAAADVTQTLIVDNNITVSLKLFLQGYYIGGGQMQPVLMNHGVGVNALEADTISVNLHDGVTYQLLASAKGVLLTDGTITLPVSLPSGNYYIAIKHRNTVHTWSANPVACSPGSPVYDFSTAASQAFGDNQILVEPGVFAFYTGDINQDEFIDGNDFPDYNTDSFNGVNSVYVTTDINGDGFVDGNDFPLFEINAFNGVSSIHP